MSRVLSSASSKMAYWKLPLKSFPLRLRWFKVDRWRIWGEIEPERLRWERSRVVICDVLEWHVMPLHEHHIGCWGLELEKVEEGSQSWRLLRGSWRDDLIERREMSWRGRVVAERTGSGCVWQRKKNVRKRRKGFMVLGWWELWMRSGWCSKG